MSITPTAGSAAPKSSGRCVITAPMSSPPFDPPWIARRLGLVHFSETRYSAAAMKSSNTFCLRAFLPASCHSRPYSPPPRRFATARVPPSSSHDAKTGENHGVIDALKPP